MSHDFLSIPQPGISKEEKSGSKLLLNCEFKFPLGVSSDLSGFLYEGKFNVGVNLERS